MKKIFIIILTLLFACLYAQNPNPNPKAIVLDENVRFTILTPGTIRLEWSEDNIFEDKPSLIFINRNLPAPKYKSYEKDGWLFIETDILTLKYKKGSGKFNQKNLEITFKVHDSTVIWKPGMENKENLLGTVRTLDGVKGETKLPPGLISRDGWTFIDDSQTPLLVPDSSDNWPWVTQRPNKQFQDWYFFAYGHNYKQALHDFISIAGKIPIPPRFAFGYWWSRYWSYTDEELKNLICDFKEYQIPIDVLVIDMDWHETFNLRWHKKVLDQAGQMLGWTGYTWNKTLFPDPNAFLNWCKSQDLKITLNLHPASGIQPHEEIYPIFAKAMGVDPNTKKYIPFNITDKKFARKYFDLIIHPLEKMGVDFWWIDWQQWDTTNIKGLNTQWWINYVFFTNMEIFTDKRPIILSRWGGLGNHRYQIGFSGDVISDWSSLQFQIYFTATAANVCFGYWSHDIGGHIPGPVEPELYTRWIQWGAFSPILRTHTTKNPDGERRIWVFPYENFKAMKSALKLRYSLIPYIYTQARKSYERGISIIHPLYYDYPEFEEAYNFKDQYMFGEDMTVAPISSPALPEINLAKRKIWIPPGYWVELFSGEIVSGPKVIERYFSIDEIPVYIKKGAIIPMQPETLKASVKFIDPLVISIFYPVDSSLTMIYEDDGETNQYLKGNYAFTKVSYKNNDNNLVITLHPATGRYKGMREKRNFHLKIIGVSPPEEITLYYANKTFKIKDWKYDGNKLTLLINLPKIDIRGQTKVTVKFNKTIQLDLINRFPGKLKRLKESVNLLNQLWPKDWSPDLLIKLAQTGNRITLEPETIYEELEYFSQNLIKIPELVEKLEGDKQIINRALNYLNASNIFSK
jgi:alpha-glucosidase (family GH31 glycosyl hydrolase)